MQNTLAQQIAPLRDIVVWRFGLYYFFVFGAFVTLAQWIVPYSVNVYQLSLVQAGLLAAAFSLPSGLIRAAGGWLSDRFGARTVMYWVFLSCILTCLLLSIPRMDINSPGEGIAARLAGVITSVSPGRIAVDKRSYPLVTPPEQMPAKIDTGTMIWPQMTSWQEPIVSANDTVQKKQLLARGVTNIYYPANLTVFAVLVFIVGVATGVGKAGVYKFIPDQFPAAVGTVGGMVGLLGALGGFFFPPVFGYLLRWSGLWSSCWIVLAVIATVCLLWMQWVARRIGQEEAPELMQLIERRPGMALGQPITLATGSETATVEGILQRVPLFSNLTAEQLKHLAQIGRIQSVQANDVLFNQGDPGDILYVILDGAVKISGANPEGQEVQLATLQAGDFFGELAIIDGAPRSAGATSVDSCQLFLIGRHDFLELIAKSPRILADLLVGLSTRIRDISGRISAWQ